MLGSFYHIEDFRSVEGREVEAKLLIDATHPILKGHFPGQPVVPGVVMMQVIRELVERALNRRFMISEADQLKFLSVIDPTVNASVTASIELQSIGNDVKVSATLKGTDLVYFKMKSVFKAENE
jgi:3-hydroxyacyl-[acyl-carrier-protein] dehydratase